MGTRRPIICVASQVPGLRTALEARPSIASAATFEWEATPEALARCEVLLGEPGLCGPLVDSAPNLKWLQSTFAGANQLLTASSRRDYTCTRLAGCFGGDMAEYCLMHVLRLERHYDELKQMEQRCEWGERTFSTTQYRRLPSLTLGVYPNHEAQTPDSQSPVFICALTRHVDPTHRATGSVSATSAPRSRAPRRSASA